METRSVFGLATTAVFVLVLSSAVAMAVNVTLSDAGLLSLDWYMQDFYPFNTATIVGVRDVPGPGVEFDIYYPGNESPDNTVYYVSSEEGGAGSLAGTDISVYDNFDLKYTLISVDGLDSPDIGGLLVVGALIGRTSGGAAYRYRPEVIGFWPSQEMTAISSTTIDVDRVYQVGIHAHMLTPDGWNPSGTTVTLLIEAAPSAVPIPEPGTFVAVDIKPGSCPNPLNVKSKGVLPVAILGSEDFDVNTIDPTSIRLAGVEPLRSGYENVAAPVLDANDCNCTEEGPDGFLDLTLKFKTQRIVQAIGEVNDGDVLTLLLTGVLFDETPVEGADCILIRGRHKPINPADINKDGVVDVADFAIFAQNWLQSSIVEE